MDDVHRSAEGAEVDVDVSDLRITNDESDKTVTLYICATMWHETRIEMMQMLKSIIKYFLRRNKLTLNRDHSSIFQA